jgi:hypothetical protein
MQVGAQSDWSTAVSPTFAIEFDSEGLIYNPNYIERTSLLGKAGMSGMDISGVNTSGDISMLVTPDNIGIFLSALFGDEDSPSAVSGSAVYDHDFRPGSATVSNSLPKLTVLVDRIVEQFQYIGTKLNSLSLEASQQDYLRATFACLGYDEAEGISLDGSLTIADRRPFQFRDGTIEIDSSTYADVTSFTLDFNNNLEDSLFTMNGSEKMQEIEPQRRELALSVDTLYSSNTNSTRSNKFKTGTSVSATLTFESTEEIGSTGLYYTLTITIPKLYITEAPPNVSGPERITQSLSLTGVEGSSPLVTVTLRDDRATQYIS